MEDSSFSLDQLQPGRNYSVVVAAVSNNIDSNQNDLMYQATSKCFMYNNLMFDATVILLIFLTFILQCFFSSNGLTGYFLSVFNKQHNFWQSLVGKVLLI